MAACAVIGLYAMVIVIIYRAIQWIHYGLQVHANEKSEGRMSK